MAKTSPLSKPQWLVFNIRAYGERRLKALEDYLKARDEVIEARVIPQDGKLLVRAMAGTGAREVEDAALEGGFPVVESRAPMDSAGGRLELVLLALTVLATVLSFLGTYYNVITGDTATLVGAFIAFICGYPILKNALEDLFERKFGLQLILAMSILAPLFYSYQSGHPLYYASGIIVLISQASNILNRYIEPRFRDMGFFLPSMAMNEKGEWVETADAHEQKVMPGFHVPSDGTVAEGQGLAVPAGSCVGSRLIEGSPVTGGSLLMEGTVLVKPGEKGELRLQKAAVAFAEARKPIEVLLSYPKSIERALLLVAIMGISFVVLFYGNYTAATAILIAAAPAAALLARPLSLISCGLSASRQGAGFMSHGSIERMSMTDAVAFDGLGSVADKASLADVAPSEGSSAGDVKAVVDAYKGDDPSFMDAREMGGHSLLGLADASRLCQVPEVLLTRARAFESQGKLTRYAFKGSMLLGIAAFDLSVPADMKASVERLNKLGVKNVMLLSSEPAAVSDAFAKKAGIAIVKPRLDDDERLEFIRKLGADRKNVLAAGRGCEISRFAANAAAVTVKEQALGFEGLEDAICSSPAEVAGLISLSKKEVKRTSEGMSFGFYFNTIAIIIASTTLVDIELVLLMVAASVVAIATNSARLYFSRLK
ncbi:MAG TPA: cation-transporting P-type ATPase [Methanocella sp.]|uniref:cation-transporting P-type ATPase n=1 Tax=Methanocella sp. TaxID=2052833 RepID=UPI002C456A2D|nr:cation-transporting P-type ATPase [Methanocella sp.]HTY90031.1 cation-transporting P-type ATPase [Methanocella sp.]